MAPAANPIRRSLRRMRCPLLGNTLSDVHRRGAKIVATNCLPGAGSNVLEPKTNEFSPMLWLYAWAAAPYVARVAIDCVSDIWNGRASVADLAQRLMVLAL